MGLIGGEQRYSNLTTGDQDVFIFYEVSLEDFKRKVFEFELIGCGRCGGGATITRAGILRGSHDDDDDGEDDEGRLIRASCC